MQFQNLDKYVHATLPEVFGWDTKRCWILPSSIYAEQKISHGGKCVTHHWNSYINPWMGCLKSVNLELNFAFHETNSLLITMKKLFITQLVNILSMIYVGKLLSSMQTHAFKVDSPPWVLNCQTKLPDPCTLHAMSWHSQSSTKGTCQNSKALHLT